MAASKPVLRGAAKEAARKREENPTPPLKKGQVPPLEAGAVFNKVKTEGRPLKDAQKEVHQALNA